MRWSIAGAIVVAMLAGACGRQGGTPAASPNPVSPTPASPRPLPGASCEDQRGGDPATFPDFVAVDLESAEGVDRVTFRFRQTDPDASEPPSYFVSYVDRLVTDGEGAPVRVEGEAFVSVSFMAVGTDLSSETPVPVYTGPKEFRPRFPTVREMKQTGDFEGVVSWGIGLAGRVCVAVRATERALVLEFPSA